MAVDPDRAAGRLVHEGTASSRINPNASPAERQSSSPFSPQLSPAGLDTKLESGRVLADVGLDGEMSGELA